MPFDSIGPAPLALLLVLVIALVAVVRLAGPSVPALLYRKKPVLSPWERTALPTLLRQLPPGCHLCPQVRLADLLAITARDPRARTVALNRIASKSVDFVVVDVASGDPRLVVELDDRSHDRSDRRARDVLVDAALRVAGIPIVRFKPGQRLELGRHLRAPTCPERDGAGPVR